MPKSNNDRFDELLKFQFKTLRQKLYWLLFLVLAITPILSISAIRYGNKGIPIFVMIVWAIAFYKLSTSFHNQKIISYWVSLPCAALILISSFFY